MYILLDGVDLTVANVFTPPYSCVFKCLLTFTTKTDPFYFSAQTAANNSPTRRNNLRHPSSANCVKMCRRRPARCLLGRWVSLQICMLTLKHKKPHCNNCTCGDCTAAFLKFNVVCISYLQTITKPFLEKGVGNGILKLWSYAFSSMTLFI